MIKDLEARNKARFEDDKLAQELESAISRIYITHNHLGRKPIFKHTKETGVYVVKEGKGRINWYRYQEKVLKPLLLPFARECSLNRPRTLVQEDGAPSHTSRYQLTSEAQTTYLAEKRLVRSGDQFSAEQSKKNR